MSCGVCDKAITRRAPGVTCVCGKKFHAKCVDLNKDDLKKITEGVRTFRCSKCSGAKRKSKSLVPPPVVSEESSVNGSDDDDTSEVDAEDISQTYNAVIGELRKISAVQKTFERSLTTFSKLIDDFTKKMKKFEKITKEVDKLSVGQQETVKKVAVHEYRLNDNDQISRMNDVEISNVPEIKGENLVTIAKTIGITLKVPLTEKEIDCIHRVPCFDKEKPKNIIVKLQSRMVKNELVAAARRYYKENKNEGLNANKINMPGNNIIFINEHLTSDRKMLFMECKKFAKNNSIEFVWVKDCKIFARKSAVTKTKLIRCLDDLKNI